MDGSTDTDKTNDSVWNFHVWNEAWFSRPDLIDPKFSGWQAIDATPQEQSDGAYQCGPCPLISIKQGQKVDYDWTFIFGEVNADVYNYVETKNGDYKQISTQPDSVGFNISTKAVGKNEREDVTLLYKFPEGSKEERASFNALEQQKELQVSGRLIIGDTQVGDPIKIMVELSSNKPVEGKSTAKVVINGNIIYYNGKQGDQIYNVTKNVDLPADGSEVNLAFVIEEDKYLKYLKLNHEIDFRVLVYSDADADVDTLLYKRFTFQEEEPKVLVGEKIDENEQGGFKVSFKNPLSIPLTNAEFTVEGSGAVSKQKSSPITIAPKQTATVAFDLKGAKKKGERIIKAQISSNELETIHSIKEVTIV
jgi:transglutaminase 1